MSETEILQQEMVKYVAENGCTGDVFIKMCDCTNFEALPRIACQLTHSIIATTAPGHTSSCYFHVYTSSPSSYGVSVPVRRLVIFANKEKLPAHARKLVIAEVVRFSIMNSYTNPRDYFDSRKDLILFQTNTYASRSDSARALPE